MFKQQASVALLRPDKELVTGLDHGVLDRHASGSPSPESHLI